MSYKNYYEEMEDVLEILDKAENPTGIWQHLVKYSNEIGRWDNTGKTSVYTPHDPNLYTIIVVDHLGLVKRERDYTKKDNIDKLSEYMIILRNKCNFIPVFISQFNRAMSSADRFKIDRVEPQLSDFKDSSNPTEDANVVLGLFSPQRYELSDYRGYNINRLKNTFRSLNILKNRDGEADKVIGLKFNGAVGYFEEFPKSNSMKESDYELMESYGKKEL